MTSVEMLNSVSMAMAWQPQENLWVEVMDALEGESGRQEQDNGSRLSCTAPIDSFETKQEGWVGNHQAVG